MMNSSAFTDAVWRQAAPLRESIINMPFNRELAAGTLPQETFQFYMLQDSLYLEAYSRVLSLAAARAPHPDMMLAFGAAAQEALVVERALHEGFFQKFGLDQEAVAAAEPSPTCLNYCNFLIATAHNKSFEEAVAAILPCFWVYWEVGTLIHEKARPGNPYDAWIQTYAGDDFANAVKGMIAIADDVAAGASETLTGLMKNAFIRSTQLEWMFWDSAYRRESWPV